MSNYSPEAQLVRLRGAPVVVLWLVQDVGCWVLGSRAGFTVDRVHAKSDWDILVPYPLWNKVVGGLPLDRVKLTRRGGFRFDAEGTDVDCWPGDIGVYLTDPFVHVAWHPSTGTIIEKMLAGDAPTR